MNLEMNLNKTTGKVTAAMIIELRTTSSDFDSTGPLQMYFRVMEEATTTPILALVMYIKKHTYEVLP
jgi:hypothetical protein